MQYIALLYSVSVVNNKASSRRRGTAMLKFEVIESSDSSVEFKITRSRIPGGWLVYITHSTCSEAGCCFVPDPQHEWDGSSLPPEQEAKAGSGIRLASS